MHLMRTFQILYDQSLVFNIFQSYVQYKKLIEYIYESRQNSEQQSNLNQFLNEFRAYSDLRICACADHVITVYMKLIEYHTSLYDMYEKITDNKHDYLILKQFHRITYYRIEICHLLLSCNCLKRLLVEIENIRRFLEKFQNDINNREEFLYEYQSMIIKCTLDFFQAVLLQHTRSIYDSKLICEENLKKLNEIYETKIWKKLVPNTKPIDLLSASDKRKRYRQSKLNQGKEHSTDHFSSTQSSTTLVSNNVIKLFLFYIRYLFIYLEF